MRALMQRYLITFLLLTSFSVHAADSLRVGAEVLTTGDSAVRVLELMGQPTIREFQYPQGGGLPANQVAPGEQWQYANGGKTTVITIIGGRVANIETLYH